MQDGCKYTYFSLCIAAGSQKFCTATSNGVERHNVGNKKCRPHFPWIVQLLDFFSFYLTDLQQELTFLMCIINYFPAPQHVSSASWSCRVTSAFLLTSLLKIVKSMKLQFHEKNASPVCLLCNTLKGSRSQNSPATDQRISFKYSSSRERNIFFPAKIGN